MSNPRLAHIIETPERVTLVPKRPAQRYNPVQQREYKKQRRKTDLEFKILSLLRNRLYLALRGKGLAKAGKTVWMLGCTIPQLKAHLAGQFKTGMTWDNHGEWEIDHIRPCCSFNLADTAQQRECFHHTNLQPLWKDENRRKRGRY